MELACTYGLTTGKDHSSRRAHALGGYRKCAYIHGDVSTVKLMALPFKGALRTSIHADHRLGTSRRVARVIFA